MTTITGLQRKIFIKAIKSKGLEIEKGGTPCMKLTIYDVAEKAGVSISTVSKVMNNQPIGKKTKGFKSSRGTKL
ncbi:LacI family DNA-binding transcriptional regulator [Ectobacillus funiculus]|uniref:LacI family DNA-binding transcriptional regulator n=1 Tax=Ectobacillus funiculus TaxID=137993 RepID=UPI00397CF640